MALPPALPRSTAAIVTTRTDPPRPAVPPAPRPEPPPAWPRWFAVATGVVLGLLVAAAWASLLLGDSL